MIQRISAVFATLTWLLLMGIDFLWMHSALLVIPILISAAAVGTSGAAVSLQRPRQIEYKPVECFHIWGKWSILKYAPHPQYPHSQPGNNSQTRTCEECGFIEKRTL